MRIRVFIAQTHIRIDFRILVNFSMDRDLYTVRLTLAHKYGTQNSYHDYKWVIFVGKIFVDGRRTDVCEVCKCYSFVG